MDYSKKTVNELKILCKENNIKGSAIIICAELSSNVGKILILSPFIISCRKLIGI